MNVGATFASRFGRKESARPGGRAWLLVFGLIGGLLVTVAIVMWQSIPSDDIGQDYRFYRDVGLRWLQDGSYYLPRQLAGPYDVQLMVDNLYPPNALLLFVPFAVLPAFTYWLVPALVFGYALYRWRPARWAVAGMMLVMLWPRAIAAPMFGNSDMWAATGVTAGLLWGWPAVLLFLKPTFAPFALIGLATRTGGISITASRLTGRVAGWSLRRSWWVALAVLCAVSLAMLPLWFDYLTAMTGVRIGGDYSLGAVPLLLVPIVGWLGRQPDQSQPRLRVDRGGVTEDH